MFGLFQPKELKLIAKALDLLESRLGHGHAFSQARASVEELIRKDPKAFIFAVAEQKTSPEQVAAASIANASGDILETGTLCMYRGLLSPLGEEMMDLFRASLNELVRMGAATEDQVEEQINAVTSNLRTVG